MSDLCVTLVSKKLIYKRKLCFFRNCASPCPPYFVLRKAWLDLEHSKQTLTLYIDTNHSIHIKEFQIYETHLPKTLTQIMVLKLSDEVALKKYELQNKKSSNQSILVI